MLLVIVALGNAAPAARSQEYQIKAGDVLDIQVLGEPNVSRPYVVRPDGKIVLPLAGEIQAAGLTARQLSDQVRDALRRFLREPQVTVLVQQTAPSRQFIYMIGQVVRPGIFEYQAGWTLAQVLAVAGGTTPRAALRRTLVIRGNETITVDLESLLVRGVAAANIALVPGDVVIVSEYDERDRVQIFGQVNTPGYALILPTDRLMDIITKAGGVTLRAAPESIRLLRNGQTLSLNLETFLRNNAWDQNVQVQAGDVIFVPETENRIVVIGEVLRPGQYAFRNGERVTDVIAAAGGTTRRASLADISLIRQEPGQQRPTQIRVNLENHRDNAAAQNPPLRPGDVIYVSEPSGFTWEKMWETLRSISPLYFLFR
jgi:protein involved in polysaccharide export with SLBB domain